MVRHNAGGTADAEAVVLRERGAEHFLLPVGVIDYTFAVDHLAQSGSLSGVGAVLAEDEIGKLVAVHHVHIVARGVHKEVGSKANLGFAALAFLGSDDDYTVRRAATVDGSCRGVLEDGHRLDTFRAYQRQGVRRAGHALGVHGHTVDYYQRLVGGRQRGTAANLDRGAALRAAAVGGNYHTGAGTYQQVLGRGGQTGLDVAGLYGGYRAGGVGFFYTTVTYHHEFIEDFGIRFKVNIDVGATVDGYSLRCTAHQRIHELGVRGYLDFIVTVEISGDTGGRLALKSHGGTDCRFAFGVIYNATDRDFLR